MNKCSSVAIVLNWNDIHNTIRAINSLRIQTTEIDILLIDNHSYLDVFTIISNQFPDIRILRTDENLGVAGGRNIGIKYALKNNYDYIFFMDNDAFADRKLIETFTRVANDHPDIAMLGSKIYLDSDCKVIWRAGCSSWKWTYLHSGFVILNRFCNILRKRPPAWIDTGRGENQKDLGQFDTMEDIDFQIGCAQFIRASAFKEIGLLDMDFCPYGSEDIDFCARLKKRGCKIRYIPEAICWHRSESSFSDSYDRSFYNMRNILLLARKHLNPFYFSFVFIPDFIFLTLPLIIIEGLLKRQKNRLKGLLCAISWNIQDTKKRGLLIRNS